MTGTRLTKMAEIEVYLTKMNTAYVSFEYFSLLFGFVFNYVLLNIIAGYLFFTVMLGYWPRFKLAVPISRFCRKQLLVFSNGLILS